jgi:hypothetical protein
VTESSKKIERFPNAPPRAAPQRRSSACGAPHKLRRFLPRLWPSRVIAEVGHANSRGRLLVTVGLHSAARAPDSMWLPFRRLKKRHRQRPQSGFERTAARTHMAARWPNALSGAGEWTCLRQPSGEVDSATISPRLHGTGRSTKYLRKIKALSKES